MIKNLYLNYKIIILYIKVDNKTRRVVEQNSLNFKIKTELNKSNEDVESLAIEVINKTTKNVIINLLYRPPAGKIKPFKTLKARLHGKYFFQKYFEIF